MNEAKRLVILIVIIGLAAAALPVAAPPAHAQDPALVARMLARINGYRIQNGLPPYALNSLLSLSAQRHSQYQASIGTFTHDEPDGSRALQRAQAVGYPAIRANENVYMGQSTPEQVVDWWYTADPAHRNNILHTALREVGLGVAADAQGQLYWTMDISAQPNVLPIFINNGDGSTNNPGVTLTLWNEDVFPGGPGQIGQASQVMISNSASFTGAQPQGWARFIPWTLDTSSGASTKTVYVRFIDSAGRTADSQASIAYGGNAGAVPVFQPTNPPPPTVRPPARIQPTTPAPTGTPAPQVAIRPAQPTVDYSALRQAYQAAQTDALATDAPAGATLGLPLSWTRMALLGVLVAGIGLVMVGVMALVAARRRSGITREETHGED